ncbi:DUF4199 domain-containing protein [Hymenobacter coccineus]|uniref:DUF4199 domain-containing protein n=1 Tax=Hymenobacter coccineus TaxID=1908235 RepID=A0A1G1TII0_9BACT|nr:DUF4199 domain-containing protein [Hymenobacter coccineus]OGX90684.1 hypothetical protein BEN49_22055 [Hymenobacter coccineus]
MTDTLTSPGARPSDAWLPVQWLALRFGGGVGLVCGLWVVGLHLTGNNAFGPKQLLAELLVPFAVVASQWTLRRQLRPAKPGLGRALGVGALTTVVAAALCAGSVWGLGQAAGESALARHRAEIAEIMQTQLQDATKKNAVLQLTPKQRAVIAGITVNDLALANFQTVLLLGLVFSLPGGIFFRE